MTAGTGIITCITDTGTHAPYGLVRFDLIHRNPGLVGNFSKCFLMRFLDCAAFEARNFLGCYSLKIRTIESAEKFGLQLNYAQEP